MASQASSIVRTNARPNACKTAPRRSVRSFADAPTRSDIYAEVTAKVIAELEAGRVPWVQPWKGDGAGPSMPTNGSTGRRYSGVNVLLLWSAAMDAGYASNAWMTFAQAKALGASVRKGERGSMIVYADRFTPANERERAARDGDEARAIPFLKRHTVFNVSQIDGLPDAMTAAPALVGEREQHEAAERLILASGVDVRIGGDKAFYVPSLDFVQMPDQRRFYAQIDYYRTACHELTHATGHSSRLDRKLLTIDGMKDRAREELVAEMGSAFVLASLGIIPTVRHSDYIAGWLDVLRGDPKAIFKAASAATKAADWLLAKAEG